MELLNITPGQQPITMSSREIAELVEKRHDSVKRTINTLVERGTIVQPQTVDEQEPDAKGRQRTTTVYHLGKRDTLVVVAQLSPEFTARVVDRWQQLESERQSFDPVKALNDPAVMRHLLLTYSERVLDLEQDVAELTPKAAALDRIATADGSECITDTAKALGMRPKDLFAWLSRNKWIHRRAGCAHWIAYQDKLTRGLLEHKVTEVTRGDGSTRISEQVRVTAKGITLLSQKTGQVLL